MLTKLLEFLQDKRIMILGYGREGKSTYKFLREHFPEMLITIVDSNLELLTQNIELTEDIYVEVVLGTNYFDYIDQYDLVVKAPGVSLKDYDIEGFKDKIYSQLQLFLEFVPVYTIGITGTKGKSTTSTLIHKMLIDQGKDALLLGNIGEPYFNYFEQMNENTICVLELSSHALEYVHTSPNIAILLNLFEEHLDHYKSFSHYEAAKYNIVKFQKPDDYYIYNVINQNMIAFEKEHLDEFGIKFDSHKYAVLNNLDNEQNLDNSDVHELEKHIEENKYENYIAIKNNNIVYNGEVLCSSDFNRTLLGDHNLNDILFVFCVAKILNLDIPMFLRTLSSFKPLEHRLEFVVSLDGVDYYNDSISTIPAATINAVTSLERIKPVDTLIVGGKNRGVNLEDLYKFLLKCKVRNIICMPKTGEFIYDFLKANLKNVSETEEGLFVHDDQMSIKENMIEKVKKVETIQEAVYYGKLLTKKNSICLLSPAASSYGYFKNFEDRGRQYKQAILPER